MLTKPKSIKGNKNNVIYFNSPKRRESVAKWFKEETQYYASDYSKINALLVSQDEHIAFEEFKSLVGKIRETNVYYVVMHNVREFGEIVLIDLFKRLFSRYVNKGTPTKKIIGEDTKVSTVKESIEEVESRHYGFNVRGERESARIFFRIKKDGSTYPLYRSIKTGRFLKRPKNA